MSTAVSRYRDALLATLADLPPAEIASLFTAGEQFKGLLEDDEELRRFFISPFFSFPEKKQVFDEIADRFALGVPLRNLFLALLESRRPLLFSTILEEAQRRYRSAQGIVDIEVRSAVLLDDEMFSTLRPALEKLFGKSLVIRRVTDPDLLGGVIVRHENTVYDASLKNHLRLLADSLKKGEQPHA